MTAIKRTMQRLAWQGWVLRLPRRWHPLGIEGDRADGHLHLADGRATRLELTWKSPKAKRGFDTAAALDQAMRAEIGASASRAVEHLPANSRWTRALRYIDPEPPGRNVWIGHSAVSGRVLQMIYQTRRGERGIDRLAEGLEELSPKAPQTWEIFDLHCEVPADLPLEGFTMNLGDKTLRFGTRKRGVVIRQISGASLALNRWPPEKWLSHHCRRHARWYRTAKPDAEGDLKMPETQSAFTETTLRRRKRWRLRFDLAPTRVVRCFHDASRDRLHMIDATDIDLCHAVRI